MTDATTLEIDGPLKTLPDPRALKKITGVYIHKLRSLEQLPPLPAVTSVGASSLGLKSLRGIERLGALESINLDDNKLGDLAPLGALKKFRSLSARRCGLRSLRGLPASMRRISVSGNALAVLEGIEKMTKLEELFADDNKLTSIPDLSKLTKLQYLTLGGNRIERLENLEGLRALVALSIEGAAVTSVSSKTAAWLRKRPKAFDLQVTAGDYRRVKIDKWLETKTIG